MNYTEYDADASSVDAQESADEAAAQAQIEYDQAQQLDAEPVPF